MQENNPCTTRLVSLIAFGVTCLLNEPSWDMAKELSGLERNQSAPRSSVVQHLPWLAHHSCHSFEHVTIRPTRGQSQLFNLISERNHCHYTLKLYSLCRNLSKAGLMDSMKHKNINTITVSNKLMMPKYMTQKSYVHKLWDSKIVRNNRYPDPFVTWFSPDPA